MMYMITKDTISKNNVNRFLIILQTCLNNKEKPTIKSNIFNIQNQNEIHMNLQKLNAEKRTPEQQLEEW